jgi:hypothetical protein
MSVDHDLHIVEVKSVAVEMHWHQVLSRAQYHRLQRAVQSLRKSLAGSAFRELHFHLALVGPSGEITILEEADFVVT